MQQNFTNLLCPLASAARAVLVTKVKSPRAPELLGHGQTTYSPKGQKGSVWKALQN